MCYVLVDSLAGHAFCSRYDMGPWPLLPAISSLSASALQVGGEPCLVVLSPIALVCHHSMAGLHERAAC